MKSLLKYSFMALVAASALLTGACTDEAEYTAAPAASADSTGVYFSLAANNIELSPSAEQVVNITAYRKDATKEQTVPVKLVRNDDKVFEAPATVTFAAGQPTATITLKLVNAQLGKTYSYELLLDTNDKGIYSQYYQSNNPITSGSVLIIDYQKIGEGLYTSGCLAKLFNLTSPLKVEVYESKTPHWYKIPSLAEDGKDIVFKVDDNNNVTFSKQALLTVDGMGVGYLENSGMGTLKDNKITFNRAIFTVAGNQYGYYTEVLELPASN